MGKMYSNEINDILQMDSAYQRVVYICNSYTNQHIQENDAVSLIFDINVFLMLWLILKLC